VVASLRSKESTGTPVESLVGTTGTPKFDFGDFFHGHTKASGWFSDRFGKPRRHFCGDFYGSYEDGCFRLDETLFYTDGIQEHRVWDVNVTDSGVFTGKSDSMIGDAHGRIVGDTLRMRYKMKIMIEEGKFWDLDMKDMMILQPDGSLHNITHVYKWGVRIGTVSTQFHHYDGKSGNGESSVLELSSTDRRASYPPLSSVGSLVKTRSLF